MSLTQTSNPFVGLRPFESDESLLFFGRQQQTLELLQRLHENHFVAVVGSSGSGKSSLIRAGLIPALKAGYLVDDRDRWMIAGFKPGQSPLNNFAAAILDQLNASNTHSELATFMRKIKEEGADAIIELLKPLWEERRTNTFFLIDQFEEVFRFAKGIAGIDKIDEANDFVNIMLELSERKELPIYIVITMRSDFIGDCARFFGLPEAMNQSQYLVPRLNRVQLKSVIENPIKLYGAKINPSLTARLVNDLHLTQDELPVLQHALMRTWDVWRKKADAETAIDTNDYLQTGTMEHALSQHAEEAFAELSERQKYICEVMFKALTDKESDARGIRRPQLLKDIAMSAQATTGEVMEVINVFRREGRAFLTPSASVILSEDSVIDISHESLMRIWERLITWVDEENQSKQIYLRLSQAAELHEKGLGSLWRNPELELALNWKRDNAPNQGWAKRSNNLFDTAMLFLEKSRLQVEAEIKEKERSQKQRLQRARIAAVLFSFVAIAALLLAAYAFRQKKEANNQTALAIKKTREALEQQNIALAQRKIADSNRELALQQKLLAQENEQQAVEQKQIADAEKQKAVNSKLDALHQQQIAQEQKKYAEQQTTIAETNAAEAKKQQQNAEQQTFVANDEKQKSNKLRDLAESRNLANESIILLNENRVDSSKSVALRAYDLNKINDGPDQNSDIYNALQNNWARSINNKNQYDIHKLPVRCISGTAANNVIFTADESGMLYQSSITSNGLQKLAAYPIKEPVRALSASPDGRKIIVATATGNGTVLTSSEGRMAMASVFKFSGIPKKMCFVDNENFIVLSSQGIWKYRLSDLTHPSILNDATLSALTVGRKGTLYIASGDHVKIYRDWDQLIGDSSLSSQRFDSRVTSLEVDKNEQYIAAGTYNGYVWINNLSNGYDQWHRALHLSSVNDLKFANVDNGKIQLAAASADQTIKLIDVTSILQKGGKEDIITLRGHTKWIYALYYTPDGQWLFSTSEDDKVIAWKPTMNGLYQALQK
ncbi:MAG TPA: hypothetical protein VEV83_05925 [Parafilimonas sp.]|nr:hypothetical protein [Parafilimonas sp.]